MKLKVILPALGGILLAGCNTDMWVQPKLAPLDASEYHTDGASARTLVPGTVPRGKVRDDDAFYKGMVNGVYVTAIPVKVTEDVIRRGQERFKIFCTPCHGQLGDGDGMVAKRGFALRRPPATYHTDRLRNAPVGHFYDVITNGYGAMFPYASRIEPADRWAVVAYIRTLQLSQHSTKAESDAAAAELEAKKKTEKKEGEATTAGTGEGQ